MIITPHTQTTEMMRAALSLYSAKSQSEIIATLKFIIGRGDFCAGRSWARAAIN
jgi:hypothetical protein